MNLKQKTYQHCLQLINIRITELKKVLDELSEGIKNDSKSSAGDKHETSRAMAQIEQEKISRQLAETLEQKAVLEKLEHILPSPKIIKGSLVKTNTLTLYISIPLGRMLVDNTPVFAISPQSPLGAQLMGLEPKDSTRINGVNYFIESIE